MEHSPSCEANSHSTSQEMSSLLWNLKVQEHIIAAYPEPNESSHTFPPYFPKIHSYPPTYTYVFHVVSSLLVSQPNSVCISHITFVHYMPSSHKPL